MFHPEIQISFHTLIKKANLSFHFLGQTLGDADPFCSSSFLVRTISSLCSNSLNMTPSPHIASIQMV